MGIPRAAPRRSHPGTVRLTARDINGLLLCAEQYAAPYDLLGATLGAQPSRLRAITARWRAVSYAATGMLPTTTPPTRNSPPHGRTHLPALYSAPKRPP
jgi:hypothetical protein